MQYAFYYNLAKAIATNSGKHTKSVALVIRLLPIDAWNNFGGFPPGVSFTRTTNTNKGLGIAYLLQHHPYE